MKVLAIPIVLEYLENLVPILYEKGYFSFADTAQKYVDDLSDDIFDNLPQKRHKPAPKYYDKYGKGLYYAIFTKNKRTIWYAFFSKYRESGETVYLIRYIGNNHTDAQYIFS